MVLKRVVKAKNQRVKRALQKKDPQVHENDKNAMVLKGGNTSETISSVLKDLSMLKKPLATMFKRKNVTRPFEDPTSIEFFANKSDSSLFVFGSHSKKRPNNLVFGRLFDYRVLDMVELGIEKYKSMSDTAGAKCSIGTKPCLVFSGEEFDVNMEYKRLKSLFLDFFRGPKVPTVRLNGLEHVMHFTAVDGKIYLRSYRIVMKKSGSKTPRVEVEDMGPSLDLVIRRSKIASEDLYKLARRQPKGAKIKKTKNISKNVFGTMEGRIHMQKQDLDKLQTRKMKGLKRKAPESEATGEQPTEKVSKETDES